jgi:glycosyltransferase involved in cell wall biosynthesis
VDYPFKFYPTPFHKIYTKKLERRVLRASSHIITTNRRVKELLLGRYSFLTFHDVEIVPQGYDPDDIDRIKENGAPARKSKDIMRITYAGVFWEDRRPDTFLHALHDLFRETPDMRGRIQARFLGTFREHNKKLVEKLGLTDAVEVLDYLPHHQCINELAASDVLWVIVGDGVGSPGKTYEYIGVGKPILGLVPEGFLKNTIVEAGGRTVPPHDVDGVKRAIREFYDEFRRGELRVPDPAVVRKYDRRALTGSVVKIFELLVEE